MLPRFLLPLLFLGNLLSPSTSPISSPTGIHTDFNPTSTSTIPNSAAAAGGTWRTYPCVDCVFALATTADAVWTGSLEGGVVRWSTHDGSYTQLTKADGLPGMAVRDIAADKSGKIWFLTWDGPYPWKEPTVSRFDGQAWLSFSTTNGLLSPNIADLEADGSGGVWVGTSDRGIQHFDGQKWTNFTTADGLPSDSIAAVAVGPKGETWVTANASWEPLSSPNVRWISHFDGGRWSTLDKAGGQYEPTGAIGVDNAGHLWSAIAPGVAVWDGGRWTVFGAASGYHDGGIAALAPDNRGGVWLVHDWYAAPGASHFDGRRWRTFNYADGLPAAQMRLVRVAADGSAWLGGLGGGLGRFDGSRWSRYPTRLGLDSIASLGIAVDRDDNVWAGLVVVDGEHMVSRYDRHQWTSFGRSNGLPEHLLNSVVAAAPSGQVWFGGNGVSRFDGVRWPSFTTQDGLAGGYVTALGFDNRGGVWAGTRSNGASRYDGASWHTYSTVDGLPSNVIKAIAGNAVGEVWFGTDSGAARFDGRVWTSFDVNAGLASNQVTDIAIDHQGHPWFATENGVSHFDGQAWTTFAQSNGLPGNFVRAVAVDAWNNTWVSSPVARDGGDGRGISRFDGKIWTNFTTADGLLNDVVFDIATDSQGHVWLAGLLGVSEFVPDTAAPATPVPAPTAAQCVCDAVRHQVPAVTINDALANPGRYFGWQMPLNPNKPTGPGNPLRSCLGLRNPSVPYQPSSNSVIWKVGCP